jgi:hypothetical protein
MSLSRREFLEASGLTASGAVVSNALPFALRRQAAAGSEASSEVNASSPPALVARIVASLNPDWQFSRPELPPSGSKSQSETGDQAHPPAGVAWERVNLPHTVRLESRDVSGGRNYQGVCWYRR